MEHQAVNIQFIDAISEVDSSDWDTITRGYGPFLTHRFLHALECSESVTAETGWKPFHMLISDDSGLIGVAPAYLKGHSYGEYVFDFAWADAYGRHGMRYYPKLLNAIPFTPVTGKRFVLKSDIDSVALLPAIVKTIEKQLSSLGLSSWHSLFLDEQTAEHLKKCGMAQRLSVQFQWFNKGYSDFQNFLDGLTARRRKSIRKERQKISAQGVSLKRCYGQQITQQDMNVFYQCYQQTYLKRSGHAGYLTESFFSTILNTMRDDIMLVIASKDEQPIAGALYFYDLHQLCGRYWGALEDIDGLHFEACYYQGIEFCIEKGIESFNPGTQGEHKVLRGFEPIFCRSAHLMADDRFQDAIERAVNNERLEIQLYHQQIAGILPFKQE